jgi:hypothetical protein
VSVTRIPHKLADPPEAAMYRRPRLCQFTQGKETDEVGQTTDEATSIAISRVLVKTESKPTLDLTAALEAVRDLG